MHLRLAANALRLTPNCHHSRRELGHPYFLAKKVCLKLFIQLYSQLVTTVHNLLFTNVAMRELVVKFILLEFLYFKTLSK